MWSLWSQLNVSNLIKRGRKWHEMQYKSPYMVRVDHLALISNQQLGFPVSHSLPSIFKIYSSKRQFESLTPTTISELRVETPAENKYLLLRVLEEILNTPLMIETIVEDKEGTISHISILKPFFTEAEEVLFPGSVIILKEPYILMIDYYSTSIGCGCPSDFIVVGRSHPLRGLADDVEWKNKFSLVKNTFENGAKGLKSAPMWKDYGNFLFKSKKNYLAIEAYLVGLQLCSEADPMWKIINTNLSAAYLAASYFEKAAATAVAVLKKNADEPKALYRAGKAYYSLRDYKKALNYFQKLKVVAPNNSANNNELNRVKQRIKESETGKYDLLLIDRDCKHGRTVDCADYVGPIKVQEIEGRGRGIVVTEDVKPGTLLIVSKALGFVFNDDDDIIISNFELISKMVQTVAANPNFYGPKVYDLSTGIPNIPQEATLFCDSETKLEPIVEVERIKAISALNSFFADQIYPSDDEVEIVVDKMGTGLFDLPSYINHSCIPNIYETFRNDVMFIRASRPIKSGEEILLSYVPLFGLSFEERQQRMVQRGFVCNCLLCQVEGSENGQYRHYRDKILLSLFMPELSLFGFMSSSKANVINAEKTYVMSNRKLFKFDMVMIYLIGCKRFDTTKKEKENWIKRAIQSLGFDPDAMLKQRLGIADLLESTTNVLIVPRLFLAIAELIKFYVSDKQVKLARIWLKIYCQMSFILAGEDERVVKRRLPSLSHLL